jgi:hypothetical protein
MDQIDIKKLLQNEKQEIIINDLALAPAWVKNSILKLLQDE